MAAPQKPAPHTHAFHWATYHGGGGTPANVKRRTMALRYVGPRCFMSPRSTHTPEQRDRWLRSKVHPFEGPDPAFRVSFLTDSSGGRTDGTVGAAKGEITFGARVQ